VTTSRVLTRNIFSNWSNLGVNVVVGFLMLPFLVSRLGDSLYGIWVLVVAVVGYGNLLDFGVRSSIVKYVSQRHATNDREGLQRLFNTTLVAYSAIGVVILALAAGAAAFLSQLFVIPSELSAEARVVVVVVGLNLALKFPSGVFEGFLTGLQRYELANAIAIGATLLRASLTVAWLLGGGKLLALAAVGLMTDTLMSVVIASVCWRLLPWLVLRRRYLSGATLREVYVFGLWSSVIAVASRIIYDSDAILIGALLPASAITHFAVGNNPVRYLRQLAYGFGNVFTPAASDLEARGDRERLGRLLIRGSHFAMVVILPAALLLAVFGREFLALWIGPRFAVESGAVLVILVLSQTFAMAQFPAGAVLYGLNRHRDLAFILIAEAILKVVLSLTFMPSFGIVGIALGTAIPELVASLVLIPILATRFTGVPLSRYFREVFFRPIACSPPVALLVISLKIAAPPVTWAQWHWCAYSSMATACCITGRNWRQAKHGIPPRRARN